MLITPVEQEILNYLKDNPGVSKADIVRYMRDKQMASKMTVFDYLEELENKNMIYGRKQRPNSQSFMMYVNEDNRVLTALLELDNFKNAYSLLLQKSKNVLDKKDYSEDAKMLGFTEINPSKWSHEDKVRFYELEGKRIAELEKIILSQGEPILSQAKSGHVLQEELDKLEINFRELGETVSYLLITPIRLFYQVVDIIFYLSMLKWPRQINNKEALLQIYFVTYSKIAEIQLELSEFIETIRVIPFSTEGLLIKGRHFHPSNLIAADITYGISGMRSEIKEVINSLVTLNEDIKEMNPLDIIKDIK